MRQSQLWNKCAVRADSVHVRHAIVKVNVVIGVLVVHGELLVVVGVVPVFVDCDAVVLIHFILIALYRSHLFSCRSFRRPFFCIWRYSVYSESGSKRVFGQTAQEI